jgi:hypothetical protein
VREPRRIWLVDAALYGASALWAAGVALWASIPLFREWGRMAIAPYALGAAVAALIAARGAGRWSALRVRAWLAVAVFAGAALAPLAVEALWRARTEPGLHAQSEAIVTEEAATALLDGRDPYAATYEGALAERPLGTRSHFPYLPAMLGFGLPRALDGRSALADARIAFALATLVAGLASLWMWRTSGERRLRAAQVLAILPTGALPMVAGGDDLPVLALMLFSLVLVGERKAGWAGAVAGLAAAMKQTAWPLLPFLVLAARLPGGRAGLRRVMVPATAVPAALILPFLAWDPSAFLEDVVLFPLGLGEQATAAGTTTVGTLLVAAFPASRTALVVAFALIVAGMAGYLLIRRPPATIAQAAGQAGLVMAVALVLAPAARFGYVIYPVNLVLWAGLLARRTVSRPG